MFLSRLKNKEVTLRDCSAYPGYKGVYRMENSIYIWGGTGFGGKGCQAVLLDETEGLYVYRFVRDG